jgi:lipoprotein-anchoring transpeptidase ErfK/SrfK
VSRLRSLFLLVAVFASGCVRDNVHTLRISVADQKMVLTEHGQPIATYPVSTSKFGLGDRPGSNCTPLGTLVVKEKIGYGQPPGMKFKNRRPTGEIVPVDAPGRDPIVTRILRLKGLETQNRLSYERMIYIHGTPEERNIGTPMSYGCIRMRSADVMDVFSRVGVGAKVYIKAEPVDAPLEAPPEPLKKAANHAAHPPH